MPNFTKDCSCVDCGELFVGAFNEICPECGSDQISPHVWVEEGKAKRLASEIELEKKGILTCAV